jgi:Domain of unknown function (DUF3471)
LSFHDWNTLAARIQSERKSPDAEPPAGKTSPQEFIDLFRRRVRPEITLDASILDAYVGYYLATDNHVFTITRDGNQLLTRFTGQLRPVPFYPESETEFFAKILKDRIVFITDAKGQVESLILHQPHRDLSMKRIDAARAQQIEGKRAEMLKSESPSPGTDAALRRLIDGLINGEPNYDEMNPQVAAATRDQLRDLHADLAQSGLIQSIRFLGVGNQGEDVYAVKHERGEVRHWRIALDSNGTISMVRVSLGL